MKRLCILLFFVNLFACTNSGSNPPAAVADTAAPVPVAAKPSGPPTRVSGMFKGILPCKDCTESETMLTFREDKYDITKLNKGTKDKSRVLESGSGYCVFESGIIKLLEEKTVSQMFKIISEDTICLLDDRGVSVKGKNNAPVLLVRKKQN